MQGEREREVTRKRGRCKREVKRCVQRERWQRVPPLYVCSVSHPERYMCPV